MVKSNKTINVKRISTESVVGEFYTNTFQGNHEMLYASGVIGLEFSDYPSSHNFHFTTKIIHKTTRRIRSHSGAVSIIMYDKPTYQSGRYLRSEEPVEQVVFVEGVFTPNHIQPTRKDDINLIIQKPKNVLYQNKKNTKGELSFPEKVLKAVMNDKTFMQGLLLTDLETNVEYIANNLTKVNPDKIQFELTGDKSIYYTLIKGAKIVLFDHYLKLADVSEEIEGESDINAIYSIYDNKRLIERFEGGSMEALAKLQLSFQD